MDPLCASVLALHFLFPPPEAEPFGLSHSVAGRLGVIHARDPAGNSRTGPVGAVHYAATWRHQFDSGARIAFSVGLEAGNLNPDHHFP